MFLHKTADIGSYVCDFRSNFNIAKVIFKSSHSVDHSTKYFKQGLMVLYASLAFKNAVSIDELALLFIGNIFGCTIYILIFFTMEAIKLASSVHTTCLLFSRP